MVVVDPNTSPPCGKINSHDHVACCCKQPGQSVLASSSLLRGNSPSTPAGGGARTDRTHQCAVLDPSCIMSSFVNMRLTHSCGWRV